MYYVRNWDKKLKAQMTYLNLLDIEKEVNEIIGKYYSWKVFVRYNKKYTKVIASANAILRTITIGEQFFNYDKNNQKEILQHEVAHIIDVYTRYKTAHDTVFKDLCFNLYGKRSIGNATIKRENRLDYQARLRGER